MAVSAEYRSNLKPFTGNVDAAILDRDEKPQTNKQTNQCLFNKQAATRTIELRESRVNQVIDKEDSQLIRSISTEFNQPLLMA